MGKIVPFVQKKKNHDESLSTVLSIPLLMNKQIHATIAVFPEDMTVIIRLLMNELKDAKSLYNEASQYKSNQEMLYWKQMIELIEGLLKKIKTSASLELVLNDISFLEYDCLIGSMEEYIQSKELQSMQLISDDSPLLTNQVKELYQRLLPEYEKAIEEYEDYSINE